MDYGSYISGISFRFVKPHTPLPSGLRISGIFAKTLQRFNVLLDVIITKIANDEQAMKNTLYDICKIPRMSTFAIAAMINRGVSQMPDTQAFVNVGVWNGFTLLSGMVNNPRKKCIGIDNFSESGGPREAFKKRFDEYKSENHYFYEMDYIEYFARLHKDPIGFYIYDGSHDYENQLKGLEVAEPFFAEECVILVDDTNWAEPRQGTLDFIARSSYRFRVLLDKKTSSNRHPTFWNGIMILQRSK